MGIVLAYSWDKQAAPGRCGGARLCEAGCGGSGPEWDVPKGTSHKLLTTVQLARSPCDFALLLEAEALGEC